MGDFAVELYRYTFRQSEMCGTREPHRLRLV